MGKFIFCKMGDILEPGEIIKPQLNLEEAKDLLKRLYGLTPLTVKEFNSYDDRNFYFTVKSISSNPHLGPVWPQGYILKVTNKGDSKDPSFSDAQNEMILHMAAAGLAVPEPVKNCAGNLKSLETFTHKAYDNRNSIWFLSSIPAVEDFVSAVPEGEKRKLVVDIIDQFCESVIPASKKLDKGIIHGDFNEQNILCQKNEATGEYEISSVIDFGDSQYNPLIYEVSIAIMYMMTKCTTI